MRLPVLSPTAYRRVTLAALLALGFIIVTGASVRLTGSGLGCPDWPTCADDRLVAPWEYHAMVEFVNRTVTGLVSVAVILAVLGSVLRRPRRRQLTLLSLGLVAGVVAQIVLGGLTVLFELKPPFVMAHFLLSMVILANAVVLHERAGQPEPPPSGPRATAWAADPDVRRLGSLAVVAAGVVLVLGTVVTSSGPHGGDENAERLPFDLPDVARLHGVSVLLFLLVLLAVLWRLRAIGSSAAVVRRSEVVLGVSVAQAALGYTQYLAGVPALLVGLHVLGAAAVWAATIRLRLALTGPAVAAPPAKRGRDPDQAAVLP